MGPEFELRAFKLTKQVLYIFALVVLEMGLCKYFPGLALNRDPLALSLPSS
jgi:hypothetical protein